jgi:hypothetical protein
MMPSPTSSSSVSPSAEEEADPFPTQKPVAPPTSQEDAFAAANNVVNADQQAFFDMFQGADGRSLFTFESGNYREFMTYFVHNAEGGTLTGQVDLWLPDYAKSTSATLVSEGEVYPYGIMRLTGCFQTRSSLVYEGESPTAAIGQFFPTELIVQYEPKTRVWLITDEFSLNDLTPQKQCLLDQG